MSSGLSHVLPGIGGGTAACVENCGRSSLAGLTTTQTSSHIQTQHQIYNLLCRSHPSTTPASGPLRSPVSLRVPSRAGPEGLTSGWSPVGIADSRRRGLRGRSKGRAGWSPPRRARELPRSILSCWSYPLLFLNRQGGYRPFIGQRRHVAFHPTLHQLHVGGLHRPSKGNGKYLHFRKFSRTLRRTPLRL